MLAMDPAKIMGFRDSHIFFNKNPTLERVRLSEEEKDILVERNMVLSWFRHRDVAVVTAQSVFKRFGAKIIKKGKRCRDDYFEARAREQGYTGETITVEKKSEVMALGHSDDPFGLDHLDDSFSHSRQSILNSNKISTTHMTDTSLNHQTWLHHSALASRRFNSQLRHCRDRKSTFYDAHTNINQVPSATQPTKCQFISLSTTTTKQPAFSDDNVTFVNPSGTTITFDDGDSSSSSSAATIRYLSQILDDYSECKSNDILNSLPSHIRPMVSATVLNPPSYLSNNDDDEYPIAVSENQHQDAFPIDFTRFGMARPMIQGPTAVIGKTQSMMAQQHYLNQVYQYVNFTKNLPQANQFNTHPPFLPQHIPPKMNGSTSTLPNSQNMASNYQQKQMASPTNLLDETVNNINGVVSEMKISPSSTPSSQCAECHQIKVPAKQTQPNQDEEEEDATTICDDFSMVPCSKCQRQYHPTCANLTTPKQLAVVESYPWSCPECKICCVCHSAGDETKLMICDGCDRGWHTDCCAPPVNEIPEGSWLCPLCAVCHSCDSVNVVDDVDSDLVDAVAPPTGDYPFPVYLATYCGPCHINFKDDRFCPVCMTSYADGDDVADDDKEMVACDSCDRWIHSRCDDTLTHERYQELCDDEGAKYSCPLCTERVEPLNPNSSLAKMALQGLTRPSGYVIGTIAGKVKTRALIDYKNYKVGVPEIVGAGSTELPT
ncbi:unnamed protein product [Absidia cylindrospora]